jgi:YidC/Oxa1 family membrane protein insertase
VAPLVAFIPLFLQMPILVALWTAMNTEIQLRNAPFDGWWIVDLSNPDALISFGGDGITIPVLSWLPWWLGGSMFRNIPSFNVLPILMGVSMWLQQKYMPKPGMQARIDAAKTQPTSAGAPTLEMQMRQQAMMANIMSVMFPLMFYYMPSGLNLYWMATNVFGIFESLIIRKQLEREKERRAKLGPPPPKKPGAVARLFKWMAEQGNELQQKADQITEQDRRKGVQKDREDRKKRK